MNDHHTKSGTPGTARTIGILQLIAVLAAALALGGCAKKKPTGKTTPKGVFEQLAQKLEQAGRTRDAKEVRQACSGAAKRSCSCAQSAVKLALELDLHKDALSVLAAKPAGCRVGGLKAEALARARRLDEARKEAQTVLKANPHERYATYAMAHYYYVKGDAGKARAEAQKAIQRGRGRVAHLLLGLMAFHQKQFPSALKSFQQMLKLDPKDVAAIFNIGVLYHQQNHYRLAREHYLRALRIHPRHADARYNIVVLTHSVGAQGEARYQLKKLRHLVPRDPRLAKLEALLKTKAPRRPLNFRRPAPRPAMTGTQPSMTATPQPGPNMAAPRPRVVPQHHITRRPRPRPRPRPKPRTAPKPMGQTGPVGP